jgi:pyrimidine operon attenuation protein / uracil phosphoribosyltransferase
MNELATIKKYILDQPTAERKLRRMALEIIEHNLEEDQLILAGIRDNGSVVARNIQQFIAQYSDIQTELIAISLDKRGPREIQLSKTIDFNDKVIIVIDDVANSGRTMLYALKPFLDYQPKKIQTAILVSRSHNSFPVHIDYAGLPMATTLQEHIYVEVAEEKVLGAYLQ